ncbi:MULTISPECIES: amino acid ABC transporter permease [Chromohalobacter]|uniref:Amino acid ABC transporter permease n=2 Tax=Chromohalobacter TaxID=42054 RepID=A0ABV8XCW3_9GAMM|nr:amino acid ABC transporter permease [Chromohalobacter canadensis]MCK0753184.1 amino acid ABC transporter permease [Chromohalobacter japonicus]MCK0765868.1 amino acid ABC transporter permease [Chromohalobacter beijerinckii]MCK0769259.1 amino acid ABC transporter permease [Chromohalobacter canadensis]MCT8469095.1 amino acid ABC transporter permease [Chromohalobacter canadensis]MCT8472715.1 amino acid ABC transporter permease [Chromohalobacter canadensis]
MDVTFQFDWQAAIASIPHLLTGIPWTLLISFGGLAIGFLIGIIFGLLRISPLRLLRWPATVYIEIFRGTPVLVQVLFIFYGLPQLLGGPINAVVAGIAAIALNAGAYISEIVRGGVQSIEKGQREAGLSLGLSRTDTFRYIIWPQALRRMIPALGNQGIVSIKDTSLFSVIGVGELVRQGQVYIATTFTALEVYLMVALLYLAITLSLSFALRLLERKGLVGQ